MMIDFVNSLTYLGTITFEYIWFPVFVWTVFAIPITLILRQFDSIPPVYQYHGRVALLLALPLGIIGFYLTNILDQISTSVESSAKFIVVQNPISITANTSNISIGYSDPTLWLGIVSIVLFTVAVFLILNMLTDAYKLKEIDKELDFIPLSDLDKPKIYYSDTRLFHQTAVAFSKNTHIPFTYGWYSTKIVVPNDLKNEPDKCAMALQHELMHIKHRDFLLHCILMVIKTLFWFHPLMHYLHNSGKEYREIICDSEVLAENKFSKKRYATLLFELAEKEFQNSQLALSMAVNPSSLKKRIQIMDTQPNTAPKFRSSFLLTLFTACLLIITISCSDISDNGITKNEFQEAQQKMNADTDTNKQPLYILDGEKITETNPPDALSRIKSKYIKSINVLKGQEAENRYGKAGENGVIEIHFLEDINKELVFSDLKESPTLRDGSAKGSKQEDYFVAIEEMPKLVGGLASLQKRINYPKEAQEAGIQGKVIVQFIVNKQGEVENPQIIRGIGGGCDKEALRVVKQAKFEPGKQNGEAKRVQYSLPITYRLSTGD